MVAEGSDTPKGGVAELNKLRAARKRRRVSDDIFNAFHFACDTRDLDVAKRLLAVLEDMLVSRVNEPADKRKRELAPLVAAYERLWALRQPPE